MSAKTSVAVIGVGRIGLPLTRRLVNAHLRVVAHDVRPTLAVAARDSGATWAGSAEAAVATASVAFTALPGTPELEQLMLSDGGGLIARWPAGTVWVDLTSTAPDVAAQLAERCRRYGVDYLAAPISGGVEAMRSGGVELYVGGVPAVLERVRPLLRVFARDGGVHLLGDQRAACTAKLVVNAVWFGHVALYTEALLLARRAGVDPEQMREVMLDGAADSVFVRRHLPALLAGDYLTDFGIDRCVEQLEAVTRLANQSQLPHDTLTEVTRLHREALAAFGPVPGELLAAALLEHRAGRPLHDSDADGPASGDAIQ